MEEVLNVDFAVTGYISHFSNIYCAVYEGVVVEVVFADYWVY